MENNLDIACQTLLVPHELTEVHLQSVLGDMMCRSIDSADLYFQLSYSESWSLEDGIVKNATHSMESGVGVRAVSGDKAALAYSNDIELSAIQKVSKAAASIAKSGGKQSVQAFKRVSGLNLYPPINPLGTLSEAKKVSLLQRIDSEVRKLDSRIVQVNVSLLGAYNTILIAASDGTFAGDVRPLVRLNVSVIVADQKNHEQGFCGGGARSGYDYFLSEDRSLKYAKEAVRQAVTNLDAVDAPAGIMPVVLGAGWPGVLLHEAVGHGLEGDFNRKKTSVFADKMGQKVASPHCTVIDDGTISLRRGSLNIDDEGVPTQRTVLIENGILKNYMQDKLNGHLMGQASTGNGRRESYACLPLPRMTNTFMMPGKYTTDEIIASVDKGIYAVNFDGGEVDITSGKFVFSANEAYLIEKGKITAPVKGATLIGSGLEVLTKVSMVGNKLELDLGVGTCGKEGQSVPVGVGQPALKVDALTVGGTV